MANFEDFFGGGAVQVGDYISTERTEELVPANGQDIFGFGYSKLEAVMPISEAIERYDYVSNIGSFRALCVQAHGRLGWVGEVAADVIKQIDFHTGEITNVGVGGDAINSYFDACCSDIGTRIFLIAMAVGNNDLFCVVSEDTGATWNRYTLFTTGFTGAVACNTNKDEQQVSIQCDITGDNVRVVFTNSTTGSTVVYESTDVGQTWAEILTPRETLSSPNSTANSKVSRDLSTTVITSDTELYVSSGGTGTLTDRASTFPGTLSVSIKIAVSDDGSVVLVWDTANTNSDKIIFYTTINDGVDWSTHIMELGSPPTSGVSTTLISAYFDPNDSNIIFAMVLITNSGSAENNTAGEIYKIDLSTFEVDQVGTLDTGVVQALSNLYSHLGSDFKAHSAGYTYGINDGQTIDKAYSVDIAKGMILRNAPRGDSLKMFAGKQLAGLGTLGYSWDKLVSPNTNDHRCAYISSAKDIIVLGGFAGEVVNSVNSGALFAIQTSGFNASYSIREIDGSDDSSVIVAVGRGECRRTVDDGVNWTAATGLSNTGVTNDDDHHACSCIADGSTVIIAAREGTIDISTNSAVSFTALNAPFSGETNTKLRSAIIARGNDQILYAGNEGGLIKRTINQGTAWLDPTTAPVPSPDEAKVFAIACSSDGSTVICCMSDRLFLSTDSGDNWTQVAVGFTKVSYRRISISDDGLNIFAADNNGVLIRSIDGGLNFYKTLVPWEETRRKADIELSRDGLLAYAVTDGGLIYRTA